MPKIRYVPFFSIIIGSYWLIMGLAKYGFWTGTSPGAGFLPAVVGAMLIVFSLRILKTPVVYKSGALQKKAFYPVLLSVLALLAVYVIGLIIAMGIYLIVWTKVIEKYSLLKSVTIGVCATIAVYLIFKVWLMVPFPKGLLGII